MDAKYERRRRELMSECKVDFEAVEGVMSRLESFMEPFVASLVRAEQLAHALTMVQGLLSELDRKNVESIAYRFEQERMPLQWFMGVSAWNDEILRDKLAEQVGDQLGEQDGVLIFDPSGFPKSGKESVGVARQWCGRLGKVDNCQVAIYMGYASGRGQTLVDMRLFLPKQWAMDKARRRKAGIPTEIRYRTRHQLCLEMLDKHGDKLPHTWIAGDDEMGRPYWFRRRLDTLGERYLLAVPCSTTVRDLEVQPPLYGGRGPRPKRPWTRVDTWTAAVPEKAWTEIDVRDGAKGPLIVEAIKRTVVARTDKRQEGHQETLVVVRYKDRDSRLVKTDYYLSNATSDTELAEFVRVAKAEHRIEECIQRAKSEAGLADYEVRNWRGWHHHQTLSLIASWFLVTETIREKKMDTSHHYSSNPQWHREDPTPRVRMRYSISNHVRAGTTTTPKRTRPLIPLETT